MASSIWGYAKIPLALGSGLSVVLSSALYYFQNELIYPRNIPIGARTDVPKPARFGLSDSEELMLPTPDGETISAFLIHPDNKSQAKNVTVMMFHGNAGNIGHRLPIAKVLANDLGCNVFMLQYRGYGLSTGSPGEAGINIDSQTGLDYIRQREDLKNTKIVLYGQSLGGAVSIALAARNQEQKDIAGMILENTFLSIRKMIPSVMPVAKVLAPLCHEVWPSEEVLPKISGIPILFMSGLQDEIVPPSHMKRLYEIYKNGPKTWKELPHGDHNNTVSEVGYFHFVNDWMRDHVV
ncbi:hypothetical protein AAFC00_002523 [Neodothiora populina]|uniref:Serine aminopeptidase S33 domain-containing protein n=1 Tax=Neodothiora populina TaxID=2781224 RepID=A0ABR3P7D1_9PEZI